MKRLFLIILVLVIALIPLAQASYWPLSGGGNIGIGTSVPRAMLQVGAGLPTVSADLSTKSVLIKGNLEVDGKLYGNGSMLTNVPGPVSGLTARYIPQAIGPGNLGNSNIYQSAGGCIGIGNTAPGAFLDVTGADFLITDAAARVSLNRPDSSGTSALDLMTNGTWSWALGLLTTGAETFTFRSSGYGDTLVMTTAGNVGVATINPQATLEVMRNGTVPPFMVSSASGQNGDFLVVKSDGKLGIGASNPLSTVQIGTYTPQSTAALYINTGGSLNTYQQILTGSAVGLNFAVTNAGNVGVGTTVPVSKLQVGVSPTLPAGSTPALSVKGNVVIDGKIYGDGSNITGIPGLISGLTANYIPKAASATTLNNSNIYQDSAGNIGIGTASPKANLDLYLTTGIRLNAGGTYTASLVGGNGALNIASSQTATAQMRLLPYNDDIYIQNTRSSGNIVFSGNEGAPLTGNIIMLTSANLGVNNGSPTAKLDVVGSGSTTGRLLALRDVNQSMKVTVLDNGNVGVGTTDPGYLLEVGTGVSRFNAQVLLAEQGVAVTPPANNLFYVQQIDYGIGYTGVYVERAGGANAGDGGSGWTAATVDAAAVGYSYYGNTYSAAVAAFSNLDYANSTALVAGSTATYYALLAYNDGTAIRSGVFMNGNVGIGTLDPEALLEIQQTGAVAPLMVSSSATTNGDYLVVLSNGNVGIGSITPKGRLEVQKTGTAAPLMISSSTTTDGDYLIVSSAGNVGIGSTAPGATLDLKMTNASVRLVNTDDATQATLFIKNSPNSSGWKIHGYGSAHTGGANRLEFAYNDVPYVTFLPTGNVGLSTTVPAATLEIQGRAGVAPLMVSSSAATNGDYLIVLSNGNVGIGTVLPDYKFQVVTSLTHATEDEVAFPFDYTTNKATSGNDTGLRVNMTDTASPGSSRLIDAQVGGVSQFFVANNNNSYFIRNLGIGTMVPGAALEVQKTGSTPPFMVSSSGNTDGDLFIVTSAGNIGIGTATPKAMLDVNGSAIFQGNSTVGVEGEFVYDMGAHYYKYYDGSQWQQLAGGAISYSGTLWNQVDSDIYYNVGYVGINTTSPDNILTLWQMDDADALKIYGFDDKNTSYMQMHVTSTGDGRLKTSGNLFMDITGNVGIHTATPAALLNLTGGNILLDNNQSIQFRHSGGVIKNVITYDTSNNLVFDTGSSGGDIVFSTNAIERVRVKSMGNVGIATTTPNATLEIQKDTTYRPFMVSSSGAADGDYVMVTSAGNMGLGVTTPGARLDVAGTGTTTLPAMLVRDSASTVRVIILDNGNMGIGTNMPLKKLVVYSNDGQQMRLGANEEAYWDITRASTGALEFYSIDPSPGTKFALLNTGNLGVGTSLPDSALSVRTMGQDAVVNIYGVTATNDYGVVQVSGGGTVTNAANYPLALQPNAGNVGIGTTVTVARLTVGVNPAIIAGSSPAVAVKGNVDVDGDIYLSGSAPALRASTELVLRQDGDTYGPSILRLRNRVAEGGAVLETTNSTTAILTDLVFKTSSSQRNVRLENRGASARTGNPSFHIGGASPDTPTLSVGDSYAAVYNSLAIGTYAAPGRTLSVAGTGSFTGNVGIGTTATSYILQVGTTTPTVTAGSNPVAVFKGNLVVDGYLYGDGSTLTGISGLLSGLTASYIPKAATSSTLNNSNIYQDGSGNIGIGTTVPSALLNVRGNLKVTGQMILGAYALSDGATIAVDWNNGNLQYVTLGGNRAITFSNPVGGGKYTLVLIQDGNGSRTVTSWPTVLWSGGTAPTLTTTASKADIVTCLYVNSNYYCDVSQNF